MNTTLDERLHQCIAQRPRMLLRMMNLIKKDMENRLMEQLQQRGYVDFKMGDMVLLANIAPEGIINNELAKKALITKQAMSKVVKNLEAAGYIETRKHESDNRAIMIFLSNKGKQLLIAATESVQEVEQYYAQLTGQQDSDHLKELLMKLVHKVYPDL
ncbi:MAG TPA: MarR family transcriptional regulator [Chitinophaga sp.]|jgi:DNA-binding MarR family transcriptional regulator|uniref:MarR family winged helix-turn-helix transcriptional regulator n=1 Tax=Chitinophaga sp. TaxID=1869181 RepID=UPI002DBB07B7|nr:MarR family transcriptional regulator [Chitinophaga sp.]HEU4552361.1 MarR family transcriptional regulator [Chitinophaga sp.]